MINYIKNALKDVIKHCDEVKSVDMVNMCSSYNSGVEPIYNVSTVVIEIIVDLSELKLSPEGRINAIPNLLPKDMWNVSSSVDIGSTDSDKYHLRISFIMSLDQMKTMVDKAMEAAYFRVVEDVIHEAVQAEGMQERNSTSLCEEKEE